MVAASLLFLKNNWKGIVALVALAAIALSINSYLDHVFEQGRLKGVAVTTKEWRDKYDKDIGVLNGKIAATEEDSRRNAERAKEELDKATSRIDELVKQIANQRSKYDRDLYDAKGKKVCTAEQPIYLGPDFSRSWNELNKEALQ